MCVGLSVKYPFFLSHFKEPWNCLKNFQKFKYQISWKFVQWRPSCSIRTDRRTVGETDMTKLKVPFRNYENAPKHWMFKVKWRFSVVPYEVKVTPCVEVILVLVSACLSACVPAYLSVCQFVCILSASQSVCLSVCQSVRLSVYLSACQSVSLSACLPVCNLASGLKIMEIGLHIRNG